RHGSAEPRRRPRQLPLRVGPPPRALATVGITVIPTDQALNDSAFATGQEKDTAIPMNLLRRLPFSPANVTSSLVVEYVPWLSIGPACVCAVNVYFPSSEKQMVSVISPAWAAYGSLVHLPTILLVMCLALPLSTRPRS